MNIFVSLIVPNYFEDGFKFDGASPIHFPNGTRIVKGFQFDIWHWRLNETGLLPVSQRKQQLPNLIDCIGKRRPPNMKIFIKRRIQLEYTLKSRFDTHHQRHAWAVTQGTDCCQGLLPCQQFDTRGLLSQQSWQRALDLMLWINEQDRDIYFSLRQKAHEGDVEPKVCSPAAPPTDALAFRFAWDWKSEMNELLPYSMLKPTDDIQM